jgi:hypothetical protein
MTTQNQIISIEDFRVREAEVFDFYAPGKEFYLAGVKCFMMSIKHHIDPPTGSKDVYDVKLPCIECIYKNNNGNIIEFSVEWSDIEAIKVKGWSK